MRSRLYVVLALAVLWFAALGARLYLLQVVKHDHYVERAHGQQRYVLVSTPPRGTIFDSRGRELAISVEAASAFANPREIADAVAAARSIAEVLGCDREKLAERLSREDTRFVWVGRQLGPERAARLRALGFDWLQFTSESKRAYPQGRLAASVVGFVGIDPKGLAGVELSYDAVVAGAEVHRPILRDARPGRSLYDDFARPEAEPGADIYLTIDSSMQHVAQRELAAAVERHGAKGGSLVMLDPSSGAVLAMVSYPGFDPNEYGRSRVEHRSNIPLQHIFEPGSTFKLITAAAALEAGVVDPFDRFDCGNGGIEFRGRYIRDHARFGELRFSEIIAYSSNVGAIQVGVQVGEKRLYDMIRAFGFGAKTGIDLSGEGKGLLHPLEMWHKRAIAYISFGQGISVTPLQLVNAFAAIANGGTLYQPYVVAAVGRDGEIVPAVDRPREIGRPISATTARTLERMLEMVVEAERGTGKHAAIPGYRVAGKTGTAEKPEGGRYAEGKYVASFVGFAPARDPAVVCLVIIDEPSGARYHGGDAPAAVFSAVVRHALLRLGVARGEPPMGDPASGASRLAAGSTQPGAPAGVAS
ncbi:MAG: penicillin-binding protein 2 [Acidobacteria bacterium]|nr:penicillin-binding protein 2 [Acidobacteriota bacterium]